MHHELEGESSGEFLAFKSMLVDVIDMLVQVEPDAEKFIELFVQYVDEHQNDAFIQSWEAAHSMNMLVVAPLFAVHIWNYTPLPSNQYKCSPVMLPKRNERCLCGSGKKFKSCCSKLGSIFPPLSDIFLLEVVLKCLSKSELSQLWKVISHSTLGSIAISVDSSDRTTAERFLLMLDPIFKQEDSCLDENSNNALIALLHLCVVLEKPRKRMTLINRMIVHPNEKIRMVVLREKCYLLASQGEFEAAYEALAEYKKISKYSLDGIDLRLMLLDAEGRVEEMLLEATDAAIFTESLGETCNALTGPKQRLDNRIANALATFEQIDFYTPSEERLLKWLQSALANPPALLHSVQVDDGQVSIRSENLLSYDIEKKLLQLLMNTSHLWYQPDRWLFILELHPELAGNLNVLAFLLQALSCANKLPQKQELMELVYAISKAQLKSLLPNEPDIAINWQDEACEKILNVLLLLARHAAHQGRYDESIELFEWILRLNPEDELGVRAVLLAVLLLAEKNLDAASLCDRYRDDTNIHMRFGHVLALFRFGELAKAAELLSDAMELFPDAPYALLRNTFKRPKTMHPDADAYTGLNSLNKVEQVWCYQSKSRALWQRTPGAITWLKQIYHSKKPAKK
ncbi:MAG: SEC-C metal-binding domain-containing protein [Mariprofundus sp.]|nr:SEC-C metal-binding domain-containing protein [Mariprofundus sp.]